jgi:putative membrane protein
MYDQKRLHPIAIMVNVSKKLKEFIFTFIALLVIGNNDPGGKLFLIGASVIVVIMIIITSILSWLRYTYRLEQDELRIEYGIFVRKNRYIPIERIQSIDLSEGLLQRVFGLVQLKVETAGGSGGAEAEVVLSAITREEARQIQEYVSATKNTGGSDSEPKQISEGQLIYKITPGQLMLLSLTSGGVGVVISAVLAFLSQLDDFIPYERLFRGIEKWAVSNIIMIAVIVFIGFLLAWIIALFGTMLKYANFKVMKTEHDLIISQGLLERRQVTIPLKRIQAIRVNENIIRQILGYGSVVVESAGGSARNEEGAKVNLLPIVQTKKIASMLGPFLADYQLNTHFTPPPKRAFIRYFIRSWYISIPIVIVALIFLKIWGLLSLILLAFTTFWAYLKYKDAGWNLDENQLCLRYRGIIRTTVFMKKNKIQSIEIMESFFQRKKKLATIEAFVKSGFGSTGGQVIDLEKSDTEGIYNWYSRHKNGD